MDEKAATNIRVTAGGIRGADIFDPRVQKYFFENPNESVVTSVG